MGQAKTDLQLPRGVNSRQLRSRLRWQPVWPACPARLHFWLALQHQHDLWHVEKALERILELIPAHTLPAAVQAEIGPQHEH